MKINLILKQKIMFISQALYYKRDKNNCKLIILINETIILK